MLPFESVTVHMLSLAFDVLKLQKSFGALAVFSQPVKITFLSANVMWGSEKYRSEQ